MDEHRRELIRPLLELSADQHGRFSVAQWRAAGLDDDRLYRAVDDGWFRREWEGVYAVRGAQDTWHGRVMGATLVDPGRVLAARRTALRLHGIRAWEDPRPHVVVPHDARYGFDRRLVVVHSSRTLDPGDHVMVGRIASSPMARAIIEDGMEAPTPRWLDNAAEAIRMRLVTWEELAEALEHAGRIPNKRRMREALDTLDARLVLARSVPEVSLVKVFEEVTGRLVLLNHELWTPRGQRIGELDVVVPDLLMGGEGDSRAWHVDPTRMETDLVRDLDYRSNHWLVGRFPLSMLRTRPDVVERAVHELHERALARLHTVPEEFRRAAMRNVG